MFESQPVNNECEIPDTVSQLPFGDMKKPENRTHEDGVCQNCNDHSHCRGIEYPPCSDSIPDKKGRDCKQECPERTVLFFVPGEKILDDKQREECKNQDQSVPPFIPGRNKQQSA